ncbi:MAG: glutamate racemase [Chitinophagales bacterium]|nr:glutamate racemase [Chitinophagales bacterium]
MNSNPIGIFDSGIGGLTVANAIYKALPNETLIYFGDTAHLPYGDKSKDLIKQYSLDITNFLLNQKNCKAIVIACNTASAAAYEYLRDTHKGKIPIINVIDPIIEAVVQDNSIKKVGLIATNTTINSGVYQEKLSRRKPEVEVVTLATPMLVPMIEEGYANDNISHALIENYLNNEALQNIDALILGCTHYPLIKEEINNFYKGKVSLFDSTKIVADKVNLILGKEQLLTNERNGNNHFYISDNNPHFNTSAKRFFKENINLEFLNIWGKNKL